MSDERGGGQPTAGPANQYEGREAGGAGWDGVGWTISRQGGLTTIVREEEDNIDGQLTEELTDLRARRDRVARLLDRRRVPCREELRRLYCRTMRDLAMVEREIESGTRSN